MVTFVISGIEAKKETKLVPANEKSPNSGKNNFSIVESCGAKLKEKSQERLHLQKILLRAKSLDW